jgi:hypothetical protein
MARSRELGHGRRHPRKAAALLSPRQRPKHWHGSPVLGIGRERVEAESGVKSDGGRLGIGVDASASMLRRQMLGVRQYHLLDEGAANPSPTTTGVRGHLR